MVAKGFYQIPGIDFKETFRPVVKAPAIWIILALVVSKGWHVRQLNVNNAFFNGHLNEVVFMKQRDSYVDVNHPEYIFKLDKALYGLKQAPQAWYDRLRATLLEWGFSNSHADN